MGATQPDTAEGKEVGKTQAALGQASKGPSAYTTSSDVRVGTGGLLDVDDQAMYLLRRVVVVRMEQGELADGGASAKEDGLDNGSDKGSDDALPPTSLAQIAYRANRSSYHLICCIHSLHRTCSYLDPKLRTPKVPVPAALITTHPIFNSSPANGPSTPASILANAARPNPKSILIIEPRG